MIRTSRSSAPAYRHHRSVFATASSCVNDARKGLLKGRGRITISAIVARVLHGSPTTNRYHCALLGLLGFVPCAAKGLAPGPVRLSGAVVWELCGVGCAAGDDV